LVYLPQKYHFGLSAERMGLKRKTKCLYICLKVCSIQLCQRDTCSIPLFTNLRVSELGVISFS
jgi:hypothetical protein